MPTSPLTALPPPTSARQPLWQQIMVLCALIGLACLLGIFSRPIGYLSAFWPANALMLGMLLRNRTLAQSPWTWVCSLLTYMLADAITGSSLFVLVSLNIANVFGVLCAWCYLRRHSAEVLSFQRLRSVLVVFWGCLLGAIGCTLVGAWPGSLAFQVPFVHSLAMWLSGEFYNFILIVPIFLAAPRGWMWQWQWPRPRWDNHKLWPLAALVISEAMSHLIGGPGAIAFLMPAMVWAAMTYGVFPMTILNGVVCFGKAAAIAMGAFSFTPEHVMEATSYRTGLALLSLAPLAVACAYVLRLQVLRKLNHAVNHDFLTGVLARRALMERGQKLLSRLEEEGQPVAVLMADIDYFKQVNDSYGHAHGDVVLQHFATLAQEVLRPEDLIGRMGGEEFAIVLPRTHRDQALAAAQRLCECVRAHPFAHPQGHMHITLSIGLHSVSTIGQHDTLEQLLSKADEALYAAKHGGRNQVRRYGPLMAPSSI